MKKHTLLFCSLLALMTLSPAQAGKPDGKGKPEMPEQERAEVAKEKAKKDKVEAKARKEAEKEAADEVADEARKKSNNRDKSEAEMKEAGKGSETGQAKREEHRRKWWKFWD